MEHSTHSPIENRRTDDSALATDRKLDTACTESSLCEITPAYIAALEKTTREKGAAWLREYAKSFDAARAPAPYPIPADGGELVIEFFGRGLPSQR